jgi:hypothetical protein
MIHADTATADGRVLLLTPTSRDASTTDSLLSSTGIAAETCAPFTALVQELEAGAAAMLLPEEARSAANIGVLREVLVRQDPWSVIPVLVLTRYGFDSAESYEAFRVLGNVKLIERHLRVSKVL